MKYELGFIISAQVPETEHAQIQAAIMADLDKLGAVCDQKVISFGRRKLSYPIAKQKHGFYMFVYFDLAENKQGLREFDTKLKHNNNILRHLIIKFDAAAQKEAKRQAELASRPRPTTNREKKTDRPATHTPAPKPVEREKINLADIDKKLDEILEEKID